MPVRERRLIEQIRRAAQIRPSALVGLRAGPAVATGIGDDCAVLRVPPGHEMLVTTDFTIENVHFRRDWHGPEQVGRRCLTRGLSDIAAMGGEPLAAFLSLAVPRDVPQAWVNRFLKGLLGLAREFDISLAGGDTAQSPAGIQADIVVLGSLPRGAAVLRSGAKAGESVYVTGQLGGATATLSRLMASKAGSKPGRESSGRGSPRARLAVGQWLRRGRLVSAMIDLSDGLSTDLEHLCQESHVGAEIDAEAVPRAQLGPTLASLEQALHGGEDYELLFTSAAALPAEIEGVPVTRIGRATPSPGMRLVGADGKRRTLKARGWEHFR